MNAVASQSRPNAIGSIAGASPRDRTIGGRKIARNEAISMADVARVVVENDRILDALDVVGTRIAGARLYLDKPESGTRLAMAYLARLKAKKSHLVGRLRANKIAADSWLSQYEFRPDDA